MSEVKAVEVLNECLGKEFPDDPVSAIKAQRAALVALAALRDEVARLHGEIEALGEQMVDAAQVANDRVSYEHIHKDATARAARLEAENARLREDAERYRWIRDNPEHESAPYFDDGKWHTPYLVDNVRGSGGGVGLKSFETLDAAIDAARAALAEKEGGK